MNWKTIIGVASIICLSGITRADQPAKIQPSQKEPFFQIRKILPIQTQEPLTFWTAGKLKESTSLLLIDATVSNPSAFFPKSRPVAPVLFSETVCQVLVEPLENNRVVFLVSRPPKNRTGNLWMSSLHRPEDFDKKILKELRKAKWPNKGSATVKVPSTETAMRVKDKSEILIRVEDLLK